jgi:hypothetical protein
VANYGLKEITMPTPNRPHEPGAQTAREQEKGANPLHQSPQAEQDEKAARQAHESRPALGEHPFRTEAQKAQEQRERLDREREEHRKKLEEDIKALEEHRAGLEKEVAEMRNHSLEAKQRELARVTGLRDRALHDHNRLYREEVVRGTDHKKMFLQEATTPELTLALEAKRRKYLLEECPEEEILAELRHRDMTKAPNEIHHNSASAAL